MQPILIEFQTDVTPIETAVDALDKLGMIDKKTADEFRKSSAVLKQHALDLGTNSKTATTTTIDVGKLAEAIKQMPKKILGDSAKKSLQDADKATQDITTSSMKLTVELRKIKQAMSELEIAGKANTEEYRKLANQAGHLEDQIGDTSQRVRVLASDTKNLDAVLSVATGVAGTFAVAQGAAALFGDENKEVQKALLKVQSALAIVNGLQAIAITLNKDSAASVVILGGAQKLYTQYIGASTGALRVFKVALAGIGIGLAIFALVEGVKALGAWIKKFSESTKLMDGARVSYKTFQEIQEKTTAGYVDEKVKLNELLAVAKDKNIALEKRKKAVLAINELSPKYLGDITLATLEQGKETKAVNAYIESLVRKSKARAIEEILTQKQKELYEAENKGLYENVSLLGQVGDAIKAIFGKNVLGERAQDNRDDVKGLSDEIDELTKALTTVNKEILLSGDDLDIFGEKTTKVVKDVKESFTSIIASNRGEGEIELLPVHKLKTAAGEIVGVTQEMFVQLATASDETKDKVLKDLQEWAKAFRDNASDIMGIADATFNGVNNLSRTALNNELQNLQQQLDQKKISQDQYDKAVREAKQKEARREKLLAVFKATIDLPAAVIAAGVITPQAIATAIAGALELANILSQKIPAFAEGTRSVQGGTPGKDSVHALLMPKERVMTAEVNQQYTPILDAIHDKRIPSGFLNAIAKMNMPDFGGVLNMISGGSGNVIMAPGFDYDRLGEVITKKSGGNKHVSVNVNRHGIETIVEDAGNRTKYLNEKFRD